MFTYTPEVEYPLLWHTPYIKTVVIIMKSFIENTVAKMRKLHYVLKAYTFSNF